MSDVLTEPASGATPGSGRESELTRRLVALARRHPLLTALLLAGFVLRLLTQLAYRPAILYIDSFRYLDNLHELRTDLINPIGYTLILKPLLAVGDLQFVAAVQHLLGMGIAVGVYALVLRHGARRWLAALAAAPLLLDGYQLQIEHNVMADVWFEALLLAVVAVLTWRGEPRPRHAAVAGVLIGLAVLVRLVGITLVVPALAYLAVAGSHWRTREGRLLIGRRAGALLAGCAVVLTACAGYSGVLTGQWRLTGADNGVLYARTATVADCELFPLGSLEHQLCPALPREHRHGVDYYMYNETSPAKLIELPDGYDIAELQRSFALKVIPHQPLDVAAAVAADFLKGFRPSKVDAANDVPVSRWQFQTSYPLFFTPEGLGPYSYARAFGEVDPQVNVPLATVLRGYQLSVGATPPLLLGLALLAGLAGGAGLGRARQSGIRAASLLTAGAGMTVLLTAAAFEFSWRYQLPALVLAPLAGALGVTALTGPLTRPGPRRAVRPLLSPYPDEADAAALAEFTTREGSSRFAPITVVIAAYNEAEGIGPVLDAVPSASCGLPVDTLVVVDGATDDTAAVAARHGAMVCVAPRNRGQGAALRLGYALARERGAQYVVTTDADGQYDMTELPLLLEPLLAGEADFVTGSRRLGRQETTDAVRHLGVRVFAALASVLTGRRITDTSFGFRAMRAEVTGAVRLAQPQYQASELLLGVISGGFRVAEQPMTMLARTAGETKKGNNLVYGLRYGRVLVGTWAREWLSRRFAVPKTSRSSSRNLRTNSRT